MLALKSKFEVDTQQTNNKFPVKLKANILPVHLHLISEKWIWTNSISGPFRTWVLQPTQTVKIKFEIDQKWSSSKSIFQKSSVYQQGNWVWRVLTKRNLMHLKKIIHIWFLLKSTNNDFFDFREHVQVYYF